MILSGISNSLYCRFCADELRTDNFTAANMGIAASGAGSWQLRQQLAIRLLYQREVINLAFSFYLQPLVKTRQQFRAGRYKIPRLTAIPDTLYVTLCDTP